MAAIEAKAVEDMLGQILKFKEKIDEKGEAARKSMQDIKVDEIIQMEGLIDKGVLDVPSWDNLDEMEKALLFERISRIRDALCTLSEEDGPEDSGHIMYNEYAANWAIVVWFLFGLVVTVGLLFFIYSNWNTATGTRTAVMVQGAPLPPAETPLESGAKESSVLLMVIMLGALGGMLQYLGSLAKYVGNRQLKRSWLMYYLTMPFLGAGLAPVTYLLLRVGILSPGTDAGGSTISNLNLNGIYAFAALTGLFAKTATEKLNEVFQTFFRTREAATLFRPSPPGSGRAPGGSIRRTTFCF